MTAIEPSRVTHGDVIPVRRVYHRPSQRNSGLVVLEQFLSTCAKLVAELSEAIDQYLSIFPKALVDGGNDLVLQSRPIADIRAELVASNVNIDTLTRQFEKLTRGVRGHNPKGGVCVVIQRGAVVVVCSYKDVYDPDEGLRMATERLNHDPDAHRKQDQLPG